MDKAVTDQFYADIQAFAKEIPNCEFEFVNTSPNIPHRVIRD